MSIEKNKVVQFHYRLSHDGKEIESSHGGDPVAYLHGHGNVIIGMEKAMEGKAEGDAFSADIKAVEAYGLRQEGAQQRVPIKHLAGNKKQLARLKPGMIVHINTEQGQRQATVIKAGKFNVDVDTNHPLAGKDLTFDIEIVNVRDASEEEIAHGHAHGVGGHHH